MTQFLLDSNALSEPTKPKPRTVVVDWLNEHLADCSTCSIVWYELQKGVSTLPAGANRKKLESFLLSLEQSPMAILPYDKKAADWQAAEFARLKSIGKTPPFADAQIAAIAAVNKLTLVTLNQADFKNFKGLKLKSW